MLREELVSFIHKGSVIARLFFETIAPLYNKNGKKDIHDQEALIGLYNSCYMTFESMLCLIKENRLWDAMVLYRSFSEGCIRLIYICSGTEDEIRERIHEYRIILPEIEQLALYLKTKNVYEKINDKNNMKYMPYRDMVENPFDNIEELQKKYPKKDRRKILQRWSFSELTKYIEKQNINIVYFADTFLHYFALSSHFIHKDYTSIGITIDRIYRSEDRQQSLEDTHLTSLVANSIYMLLIISVIVSKECGKPKFKELVEIYNENLDFFKQSDKYYNTWLKIEYQTE